MGSKLSFEVFPTKTQAGYQNLQKTLHVLQTLDPAFVSVTCSNVTNSAEAFSIQVTDYLWHELKIPTIPHLAARYLNEQAVDAILDDIEGLGIQQVLALRGDEIDHRPSQGVFQYASELVAYIKMKKPHFEIYGACYPETHPESIDRVADIKQLKAKTEAGCSTLVTQLFFDNDLFYSFQEACALADIEATLLAGIMPIVNRQQVTRLLQTTRTHLPRKFLAILEKYEHDPAALREAGIAYAIDQIVDLSTNNVDGIHLYTLNHAEAAKQIYTNTRSLLSPSVESKE
ncbi:5,10-methylenetetrahydrofolate reductase [Enterococcus sp. 8G7_MSG3316]|uniref:Methylenetetrahydrofolate reductase n=1 Tax=Candidatus Enterococcus testudinis TaxID=1834191 RepID=A0A242A886_9ENTE|nr:methylenetetrahydrofolate reductase [NAD(P)H] [Enterococcus sp. 8G7_MSG3316]OTN76941.1 5,10-methylenetetrahydrofolate reductase [Enterococcus sp. 8G7_MSG3316]